MKGWFSVKRTKLVCVIMSLLFLMTAAPVWAGSVKGDFSPSFGDLIFDKSGFRLELPPKTFTTLVEIKAEDSAYSSIEPVDGLYVTRCLDIGMIKSLTAEVIGVLPRPARLVFKFSQLDYARASQMNTNLPVGRFRIGYWDKGGKNWIELPSQVFWNGSTGVVEAETDRGPGRYALLWSYAPDVQLSTPAREVIRIMVDNVTLQSKIDPYAKEGRTMVPLRLIADTLGARLEWVNSEQRIDLSTNFNNVKLWIGKTEADKNGQKMSLDTAPEIVDGRTFVPLRFVAEALGIKVGWDEETQTARLSSK